VDIKKRKDKERGLKKKAEKFGVKSADDVEPLANLPVFAELFGHDSDTYVPRPKRSSFRTPRGIAFANNNTSGNRDNNNSGASSSEGDAAHAHSQAHAAAAAAAGTDEGASAPSGEEGSGPRTYAGLSPEDRERGYKMDRHVLFQMNNPEIPARQRLVQVRGEGRGITSYLTPTVSARPLLILYPVI
jgi:hypothetical protein